MARVVDLTLTLRHGMRGVAFEIARTVERDGWNARTLHLYSHAGTHMDAQTHVNDKEELTRIHRILLSGSVTIVEGLANLDALREPRVFFAALWLLRFGLSSDRNNRSNHPQLERSCNE